MNKVNLLLYFLNSKKKDYMLLDENGDRLELDGKIYPTEINGGKLPSSAKETLMQNANIRVVFVLLEKAPTTARKGTKTHWITCRENLNEGTSREKRIEEILSKAESAGGLFIANSSL